MGGALVSTLPHLASLTRSGLHPCNEECVHEEVDVGSRPVAVAGSAFAAKPCEELKAEIDAKIKANGVPAYTLEIVDKGSVTDKKVVGTCDGGTKEIVYQRG